MKRTLVFAALYVAFAAGAIVTCFFGRAGLASYRALDRYADTLRKNTAELESLNSGLAAELELLRTDTPTVRVLARQLGYLEPGEHRVQLSSYAPTREFDRVGYVVQAPPSPTQGRQPLETIYLIPLVVLFVAACIDGARSRDDG